MSLTPCPILLNKLIDAANSGANPVASESLKVIARAFLEMRSGRSRQHIQLARALAEIAPGAKLDLIRECPVCAKIFWAGRSDKTACDDDTAAWRKRQQRIRDAERQERLAKERAKRVKEQAGKPIELTETTAAILDAIDERCRVFETIDWFCWSHLGKAYLTVNVQRGLRSLVEFGVISRHEPEEGPIRYTPRRKMEELRREVFSRTPDARWWRTAVRDSANDEPS